jgi:hypothetical protein
LSRHSHKKRVDIEGVNGLFNHMVNENILLHGENHRNIRPAFTTTVYAFLDPGLPSAARDFFCLLLAGEGANLIQRSGP